MEDAIHKGCNKQASELRYYGEGNEQNWTSRGENMVELGLERQDLLKTVVYSSFGLSSYRTSLLLWRRCGVRFKRAGFEGARD